MVLFLKCNNSLWEHDFPLVMSLVKNWSTSVPYNMCPWCGGKPYKQNWLEGKYWISHCHPYVLFEQKRQKEKRFLCSKKSFQAKEWDPVGTVEIFKALLMVILDFKEKNILITVGIQGKDPDSSCMSDNIHQGVSVLFALFCFPVVDALRGKCIHSRKK